MKVISFDVSSKRTGWSYFEDGKLADFSIIDVPKNLSLQKKLYWFKSQVELLLNIFRPSQVVVEETYLKNVTTLKVLMQFVSAVNVACFEVLGIEAYHISPNTVRSFFELKTKEEVFAFVQSKYKRKLGKYTFEEGNDITDSILQGLYYINLNKDE